MNNDLHTYPSCTYYLCHNGEAGHGSFLTTNLKEAFEYEMRYIDVYDSTGKWQKAAMLVNDVYTYDW